MSHSWQRAAGRRAAAVAMLALVGAALVLVADGGVETAGWVVLGLAGVLGVGLAFLEVGYSEDRARDREARR